MMRTTIAFASLFSLAAVALAQDPDLPTQDLHKGGAPAASPPGLAQGSTEDQMWVPPTADDWKKPVLIEWERTWGDAVAVAKETNKPILVCINMDGEIASEHYAGVHYRTPETAKLFADYVCVIASVYRHTPRDFDEAGNRIPCPRFGTVTCGEHIAIEPLLYEKFMGGQRISPRHIMVELDGKEMYDVFYAWDNKSILDTIQNGIAQRTAQPRTIVRGDRPVLERVASRAREDREAVEEAYRKGDRAMREQLLKQAIEHPDAAPVGLLRLAVFDVDEGLASLARQALVKVQSPTAVDVLAEALRVPLPEEEKKALVAALERLRDASPQARLLANVHRGLDASSKAVDLQGWGQQLNGGNVYRAADSSAVDQRVEARAVAAAAKPQDAEAQLDLAHATLELAIDPATADRYWGKGNDRYGKLLIEDARRYVAEAKKLGGKGWRLDAAEALCCYWSGEPAKAYELAIAAATAMPPQPDSLVAVQTLALFAEARIEGIWDAMRKRTDWPNEWMTDVNSALSIVTRHPLGNDGHAVVHFDFLDRLGAKRRAITLLDQYLERWPESSRLHDRLRQRLLEGEGVAALRRRYDEMLAKKPDDASVQWFAGYAAIVEAEFHRRDKKPELAVEAYRRAMTRFEASIAREASYRSSADHYVALSLSALARLSVENGDVLAGLDLCLQGIARCPEATPVVDGLEISPVQTANLIESKLEESKDTENLERLRKVLRAMDPKLLELPDYEKATGNTGRRRIERRGR